MALYMSLSVFNNISHDEIHGSAKWSTRILFRFKEAKPNPEWICAYRQGVKEGKGTHSLSSVPNYLECCGVVVSDDQPTTCISSVVPESMLVEGFHVLKWNTKTVGSASLQESIKRFGATCKNGNLELTELPLNEITWVEDDMAEVARRGYIPVAATLLADVPLPLESSVEFDEIMFGVKRIEEISQPVVSVVSEFLKEGLFKLLDAENEALSVDITDVAPVKTPSRVIDTGYSNLTIGTNSGYSKHAFIHTVTTGNDTTDDANAEIQLIWQTTCIVPTGLLGDEFRMKVRETAIEAFQHLAKMGYGSINGNDVKVLITPHEKAVKRVEEPLVTTSKAASISKHGSKGGKSKGSGNRTTKKPQQPQTQQSTTVDILKCNIPVVISIGRSKCDIYLTVTLDKATGNMMIGASATNTATTPPPEKVGKIKIHSIMKTFVPEIGNRDAVISFGGVTLSLLNLLAQGDDVAEECLPQPHPGKHIKLLMNSKNMCDKNILIEPHVDSAVFPQWMSNKTSRASIVKGIYQYYHYMQCGINDSGWGCCYRSIQMVVSWYLLQYYTLKSVPMHGEIQAYLKERDPSHADLVVGSTTWIGTVEAGYFINWYLNYNSKTFYLNDVNDMRNYNGVIANHFSTVGTPIIMGAGMFAYVIVGICIGAQAGASLRRSMMLHEDVAYLIADPHYAGEDNVKNIRTKGAIAWKKIDFIAKAANGGFINLCCPQLEPYEE